MTFIINGSWAPCGPWDPRVFCLQKVDEAIRADPSTNDKKLASVMNTLQHYQSIIPVHENAKGYAEIPKSPRHGWAPVVEKFLG